MTGMLYLWWDYFRVTYIPSSLSQKVKATYRISVLCKITAAWSLFNHFWVDTVINCKLHMTNHLGVFHIVGKIVLGERRDTTDAIRVSCPCHSGGSVRWRWWVLPAEQWRLLARSRHPGVYVSVSCVAVDWWLPCISVPKVVSATITIIPLLLCATQKHKIGQHATLKRLPNTNSSHFETVGSNPSNYM